MTETITSPVMINNPNNIALQVQRLAKYYFLGHNVCRDELCDKHVDGKCTGFINVGTCYLERVAKLMKE